LAGRAAAAFAVGRYGDAAAGFRRSAELNFTNAAMDLPRAARASLWEGDFDAVKAALEAIAVADLHGRVVDLERRAMHAALAARDGDRQQATREYAVILPELAEMGLNYKQALVVLDMALVLGPDEPIVQASLGDARAILDRLGAQTFLARLEQLTGETVDSRSGESPAEEPEVEAVTSTGLP
jgi:hypothetical protein